MRPWRRAIHIERALAWRIACCANLKLRFFQRGTAEGAPPPPDHLPGKAGRGPKSWLKFYVRGVSHHALPPTGDASARGPRVGQKPLAPRAAV